MKGLIKYFKKGIVLSAIVGTTALSLVGCGGEDKSYEDMSKDELISEIYSLEDKNSALFSENAKYKNMLEVLDSSGSTAPSISAMNDGSGNLTFNTYDSKMIFPSTFVYPETTEISANTKIVLSDNFSVSPSNGWITKLNGASLELEHANGVSGLIKVGHVDNVYENVTTTFKDEVMKPWFSAITKENVIYSDIFVNNRMWGTQAKTPIYIDGEDAYLKAGMYAVGNYSVQYVFVYRGSNDAAKDEIIDTLLNSMTLLGLEVSIS